MRIGVNQFCFPGNMDVEDAISTASKIGFDSIEVCYTAREGANNSGSVTDKLDITDYHNRLLNTTSTDDDLHILKKVAESNHIALSSIGGVVSFSIYPLTSKNPDIAKKSMDAVKQMLNSARLIGAPLILVIPGMIDEDADYEETIMLAQHRLAELADFAPDITLAVENVWNGMLYTPLEMKLFLDGINRDNVGAYFDIANAKRFCEPQQWIHTLGNRIRQFHVKDYRIANDNISSFTNILDGDINWPKVVSAIHDIGFDGDLVVELTPPSHYLVEDSLRYARNTIAELFDL